MTNKEALDRLTCLKLSYKIRIEEEDIEALGKGIEALEENSLLKAKIKELETELATWKALC